MALRGCLLPGLFPHRLGGTAPLDRVRSRALFLAGLPTLRRALACKNSCAGSRVWATSPIFCVRPQIFTYLLASCFIALLTRFLQKGSYPPLILLPFLTILWVNLHGAYILGPTFILLFAAGAVCDWVAGQAAPAVTKRRVVALLIACVACLVVVPLNPNGMAMLSYPFATSNSSGFQAGIMEWGFPDFHLAFFGPLLRCFFITVVVPPFSQAAQAQPNRALRLLLTYGTYAMPTRHSLRSWHFRWLRSTPTGPIVSCLPEDSACRNF